MSHTILIVDDDPTQRHLLSMLISKRMGYMAIEAENGDEALSLMEQDSIEPIISMVILDLSMPGIHGLDVLERLSKNFPEVPVIIITGSRDTQIARQAIQFGALDFISKPVQAERVIISIQNALKLANYARIEEQIKKRTSDVWRFEDISYPNSDIAGLIHTAKKISHSDISVHISGESGVGKEVFAQCIHSESSRKDAPFIIINCGAIPENLVESILFGHEKGSFTGAIQKSIGKFREAHGGTIFLDEVAELPLASQVKLLRAIQQKEIDPVGATKPVKIDVRIISATNKNLKIEVQNGRFREDLYYRINGFPLTIPSLRNRPNDLTRMIDYFIDLYCKKEGCPKKSLAKKALQHLLVYEWPGNIRQLEHTIHRAVILSDTSVLNIDDFEFDSSLKNNMDTTKNTVLNLFDHQNKARSFIAIEYQILCEALEFYDGNYADAAKHLQIAKSTLYRKMHEYKNGEFGGT